MPFSHDKYWAINCFRVQERFLGFRVFLWCYSSVPWDLLHIAVSFNLVYLVSMSILGHPPGTTWKAKSWSLPTFMEIQCEQLRAEPWQGHIYKQEQIWELIESDCSLNSTSKTKCKYAHLAAARIVLAELMQYDSNCCIPSTCHPLVSIVKYWEVTPLLPVYLVSQEGPSHSSGRYFQPAKFPTWS